MELDMKTICEKNLIKSGVIFATQTFIGARKKETPIISGRSSSKLQNFMQSQQKVVLSIS
mgnify:CR=1 FL=1